MNTPKHLSLAIAAITLIAAPAAAQDLTATLRVQGHVMVSTGGEFRAAVDGQLVVPGQRIMVGPSASATVQYSQDCKITYSSAGVYTIAPAACQDDRVERQQEQQQRTARTAEVASPAPTLSTVVTVLGTAVGIGIALDQADDEPVSR